MRIDLIAEHLQRQVGPGRNASGPLLKSLYDLLKGFCLKRLCAKACLLASCSDSSVWPIM